MEPFVCMISSFKKDEILRFHPCFTGEWQRCTSLAEYPTWKKHGFCRILHFAVATIKIYGFSEKFFFHSNNFFYITIPVQNVSFTENTRGLSYGDLCLESGFMSKRYLKRVVFQESWMHVHGKTGERYLNRAFFFMIFHREEARVHDMWKK